MSKKGPYHMYPDVSYGSVALTRPRTRRAPRMAAISDRAQILGIPVKEMTDSVSLAVTALLEKMDDMARELERTKSSLTEIQQQVDVDCLAPIPNRRAFSRRLKWALAMQTRYGHTSSILFFDLNGFKAINDTYGHAAGDAAILHVADLLTRSIRDTDFVARLGGDEFAVLLYHADLDGASVRADAIIDRIESTPLKFQGKTIALASSCGAYELRRGDSEETALARADASMYADKKRKKAMKALRIQSAQ